MLWSSSHYHYNHHHKSHYLSDYDHDHRWSSWWWSSSSLTSSSSSLPPLSSSSSSFACEQALHLWDIMKSRRVTGDVKSSSWGRERRACNDHSFIFISTPGSPKHKNCHRKHARDWKVTLRQPRAHRIYLFIKLLSHQLSTASKQCFWPLMCFFFILWTSNYNGPHG